MGIGTIRGPIRAAGSFAFDAESAADAVQEAFIQADRGWSRVATLDDPVGCVRRMAVNRLLNKCQNSRRRGEILGTIRSVADRDLSAELIDLRRGIGALPPRMRAAVCLHYVGDLRIEDVATELGVSPGTVKSNLHDARIRLREFRLCQVTVGSVHLLGVGGAGPVATATASDGVVVR